MADQFDAIEIDATEIDHFTDPAPVPRRRPDARSRRRPVFVGLHVAYHRLARRLERLLDDEGANLSPTEAVVLVAITRAPGSAIAVSRREAGLHPSTMTSVLVRLELRGLIRRERGTEDHRFVAVGTTLQGRIAGDQARAALAELDDELGVYVHPDDVAGVHEVAEASAAIGTRGTPPDY